MSPNEFQLRDALRAGEGDSPDADEVIAHASRIRGERRKRAYAIGGGIAAAAVIGLGTTGVVALTSGSGNDSRAGSYAADGAATGSTSGAVRNPKAQASSAPQVSSSAAGSSSAAASSTSAAAALSCPATADRFMLPGGGGTGQFGSGDPLFGTPVAGMRVCAYPATASPTARSVVLDQADASALASSLDAASDRRSSDLACPGGTDVLTGTLELLAVDARGAAIKPVVVTLGCPTSEATNGTAVRYAKQVPDRLRALVVPSTTKSLATTSPGRVQGSPVR